MVLSAGRFATPRLPGSSIGSIRVWHAPSPEAIAYARRTRRREFPRSCAPIAVCLVYDRSQNPQSGMSHAPGTESGLHLRMPGQLTAVADLRHSRGGRGHLAGGDRIDRSEPRLGGPTRVWQEYAALGEAYFYAIIGVELTLVMLAAPAATAGAICVDRARGTLTHMLVTELSDAEIVLGKLAARLLPILGLVACTWPVLAICSLLGGIDPTALTLAFAIILAVALLGCTMALALSVWARKPHEVVLVTYTFWILRTAVLADLVCSLSRPAGRALRLAGVSSPIPTTWRSHRIPCRARSVSGTTPASSQSRSLASALLILLAVWQMRPVARRGNVDDRKEPAFGVLARLTRLAAGPVTRS